MAISYEVRASMVQSWLKIRPAFLWGYIYSSNCIISTFHTDHTVSYPPFVVSVAPRTFHGRTCSLWNKTTFSVVQPRRIRFTFKFTVTGWDSTGSSPTSYRCLILSRTRLKSASPCFCLPLRENKMQAFSYLKNKTSFQAVFLSFTLSEFELNSYFGRLARALTTKSTQFPLLTEHNTNSYRRHFCNWVEQS